MSQPQAVPKNPPWFELDEQDGGRYRIRTCHCHRVNFDIFTSMFRISREGLLLLFEVVVLLLGMMWIKGNALNPRGLFYGAALIIAGLVANRLNTAITALEASAGQYYLPHWGEFLISYSLIAAGIGAFATGVEHLTVFSPVDPVS
jgi:uncharacterized membrane protein YiaA